MAGAISSTHCLSIVVGIGSSSHDLEGVFKMSCFTSSMEADLKDDTSDEASGNVSGVSVEAGGRLARIVDSLHVKVAELVGKIFWADMRWQR